ncbi:MAG TPA: hypothetical protein VF945_19875, partial [Polyangia bacterium]
MRTLIETIAVSIEQTGASTQALARSQREVSQNVQNVQNEATSVVASVKELAASVQTVRRDAEAL